MVDDCVFRSVLTMPPAMAGQPIAALATYPTGFVAASPLGRLALFAPAAGVASNGSNRSGRLTCVHEAALDALDSATSAERIRCIAANAADETVVVTTSAAQIYKVSRFGPESVAVAAPAVSGGTGASVGVAAGPAPASNPEDGSSASSGNATDSASHPAAAAASDSNNPEASDSAASTAVASSSSSSSSGAGAGSGNAALPVAKLVPLSSSFHSAPITGLDVCARKPLIATCSADHTVRVWNFLTRELDLCVKFPEPPLSVALHPSGHYILIGFADRLKLCALLYSSISPFKELPIKHCTECLFSNGGHLFAAAQGGSVHVFATYTCEPLHSFRGHTSAVRSIFWARDDAAIVTAGADGAVFERRLELSARAQEYIQKGCRFTAAVATQDGKLFAVGDDHILKEIAGRGVLKSLDAGVVLTQLVVGHAPERMLFAGTVNGVIRAFRFPLTGDVKDYQCHARAVSRLRITADDCYLVAASDDGCVSVLAIEEERGRLARRDDPDALQYSEEVLVHLQDLEDQNALAHELEAKLEELRDNKEYTLRAKDVAHQDALKRLTHEYVLRLEHDRAKVQMRRDEKQEADTEAQEKVFALQQRHNAELHAQAVQYQKAFMRQVTRLQGLQEGLDRARAARELAARQRDEQHAANMAALRARREAELQSERGEGGRVREAQSDLARKFAEDRTQTEEDLDTEIELLLQRYRGRLEQERDVTLRLKGENGIIQKKFKALQRDLEDLGEAKLALQTQEEELLEHTYSLKAKLEEQRQAISARDAVISEKERQIFEVKRGNQGLEKYKFVLDFQIKELKRRIEPREAEIADLRDTVDRLDSRLEAFHAHNGILQEEVRAMAERLQAKHVEVLAVKSQCRRALREARQMCADTTTAIGYLQDPVLLRAAVKQLHGKYVTDRVRGARLDAEVSLEYRRQRQYLERSVAAVKQRLAHDAELGKNDNVRVMQENVALIKEINQMRRELKMIHQVQRQRDMITAPAAAAMGATGPGAGGQWGDGGDGAQPGAGGAGAADAETMQVLEAQRGQIRQLRALIEERRARIAVRPDSALQPM